MIEVTADTLFFEEKKIEKRKLFAIKTEDNTYYDKKRRYWTDDLNKASTWFKVNSAAEKCKEIINPPKYANPVRHNAKTYTKLYVVEVQVVEKGEFTK